MRAPGGAVRLLSCLAAALAAAPVGASERGVRIVEVFAGTPAVPGAQYVVLQMVQSGVTASGLTLFVLGSQTEVIAQVGLTAPQSNGANQAHVLVATPQAEALFGIAADHPMPGLLPPSGAVCLGFPLTATDCVAWGEFDDPSTTGEPGGTPFNRPCGIQRPWALRRDGSAGSPAMEMADDTDDSARDFDFALPEPRNNTGATGAAPSSNCGNGDLEGLEACDDGGAPGGDCDDGCRLFPPLDFFTLTPCRAVDTRDPAGPLGGPALVPGASRSFPVAERCSVPAGARALVVNATAVSPAGVGHLMLYPGDLTELPPTSTLNFGPGQTRAGSTVVTLPFDGSARLRAASNTSLDLLVDVTGFFDRCTPIWRCGNDFVERGTRWYGAEYVEDCDGTNVLLATCADFMDPYGNQFTGGQLACTEDCTYDRGGCSFCGNALIEVGEVCDDFNVAGMTCLDLEVFPGVPYAGGTLACAPDCEAFDTSACHYCGDGVKTSPEDCDGADLGGQTCVSLGSTGGTLVCTPGCSYDLSGCS